MKPTAEQVAYEERCLATLNLGENDPARKLLREYAELLRVMEAGDAEIEALVEVDYGGSQYVGKLLDLARTLAAANKLLKADRNEWVLRLNKIAAECDALKAERDAIEAATAERCRLIVIPYMESYKQMAGSIYSSSVFYDFEKNILPAIDALAQKGKEPI